MFRLLGAGVLLEAFYLRMHSLYYLKNHAIGFIELALAAGVVYLIALYGIERTRSSRAATILLVFAAIAFRAPLWPMLCFLPNPAWPVLGGGAGILLRVLPAI